MTKRPMRRAIEFFGSEGKLAAATDFSQQRVNYAARTGHVPALMAFRIHAATKGRVSYVDLLDIRQQLKIARARVSGLARVRNGKRAA